MIGYVFLLLILVLALFGYRVLIYTPSSSSTIPGPRKWPIWNLMEIRKFAENRKNYQYWMRNFDTYGKLCCVDFPVASVVMLADAELIRKALQDTETFSNQTVFVRTFSIIAPKSVIVLDGDEWKRHRKIVSASFAPEQLRFATDVVEERSSTMFNNWDSARQKINCYEEFSHLTVDVIGEVAFGHKFDTLVSNKGQIGRFTKIAMGLTRREVIPKTFHRFLSDNKSFHALVDELKQIPELAGHETTANTLTLAINCIGNNFEIQERIAEEADSVLSENASYDQLSRLKYIDAIIKETFRVTPTVPLMARKLTKPVEMLGHQVKPGCLVVMNLYACHHDPEKFPDPEKFDPNRWLQGDTTLEKSLFQFGGGPRICVGNRLATLELRLVLARLYQRFRVTLVPDQEVKLVHTLTMGLKDGLLINVENRRQ